MSAVISAPFTFWNNNPVYVPFESALDNSKYNFDSILIIATDVSKLNIPNSSFIFGFVQLLQKYKEFDENLEKAPSFILSDVAECPTIRKLVYSPTGPLDRHYDDIRRFYEAASKGIERILKSGATRPLLAVFLQSDLYLPTEKYNFFDSAAIFGAAHAAYVPLEIRECSSKKPTKIEILGVTCPIRNSLGPMIPAIEKGRILCRDIGGTDPERMAAPQVANYVTHFFTSTPIKIDIISDEATITKEYPLLAAVNRAARGIERHRACVIFLTYEPPEPPTKTLYLVGKGVTYDTGGADIKANGVMAGMHRDKCGAASVAGFLKTVAELKPRNIKVVGAMCMVRNSVGSDAYVSDEIITSRCGVRIRIGNTDAEGRMAMSDILCHMKEKALHEKDAELYTIATLTGHACLAVGDYTIIMNNGPAAAARIDQQIKSAGDAIGDIFEISTIRREDYEFHKGKSEYEDVLQCNNEPSSKTPRGHQTPSAFIMMASGLDKHDINSSKPLKYSHVDIAGSSGPFPGIPTGSTIPAFAFHYLFPK